MARKDLAGVLIEEKILPARDLERMQRTHPGRPLWVVLLDAELTTEEELFFLLAQRWPVASEAVLEKVEAPDAARRVWSRAEASAHGLLPVEIEGGRATVVMVDPSDEESLRKFLQRSSLGEARALVGRRSLIERAIGRTLAGDSDLTPRAIEETAQLKVPTGGKLRPPRQRAKTEPKVQATVEIDPQLAEEMRRLPARSLEPDDSLTPRPRRRRPSPQGHEGVEPEKPFTLEDALRAEERLSRALLQAVEVLARELENRLTPGENLAGEMARLSRRVARKLGLDRRSADEVSAAAYLFAVDRKLRLTEARAADWFSDLGWPAATEKGLLPVLRALTANVAGFSRTSSAPPLGARIITVVDDFLQLGAASGEIDLGTVSQLLRASPAGAPVVDALLRVLESERVSDTTTVTAQSMLHPDEPQLAAIPLHEDKTQRKAAPQGKVTARREKE
jgi:hypothetical protein